MGEIRIPVSGQESSSWPPYMGKLLVDVVEDWVNRVEHGPMGVWHGTKDPITVEHLRIAKAFLGR